MAESMIMSTYTSSTLPCNAGSRFAKTRARSGRANCVEKFPVSYWGCNGVCVRARDTDALSHDKQRMRCLSCDNASVAAVWRG